MPNYSPLGIQELLKISRRIIPREPDRPFLSHYCYTQGVNSILLRGETNTNRQGYRFMYKNKSLDESKEEIKKKLKLEKIADGYNKFYTEVKSKAKVEYLVK